MILGWESKIEAARYDVFISYNTKDKEQVHRIAEVLRDQHRLEVWLDAWVLPPGETFLSHIETGLQQSGAIAVFVGAHGLGQWEESEYAAAFAIKVRRKIPVVPVLLPGALERDSGRTRVEDVLPLFLQQSRIVEFVAGSDDKRAIDDLVWGITGQKPRTSAGNDLDALAPRPIGVTAGYMDAVDAVVQDMLQGDTTFLLGRTVAGARNPTQPAPCELSARLLRELSLVDADYDGFVPGMESAASLLAATRGGPVLERLVVDILERAGDTQPEVHTALAVLMRLLGRRPPARRARRHSPRLILTTNFDLLMERALLRAGIPFTRLVQFRAEPRIDVTVFGDVVLAADGDIRIGGKRVQVANGAELDNIIHAQEKRTVLATANAHDIGKVGGNDSVIKDGNAIATLAIDQLPDPILYKFQGSQDIENSSAISADQSFDFFYRFLERECVPSQITGIISSSMWVALGSSVLGTL